jgi:hypothetical protein
LKEFADALSQGALGLLLALG